MITRERLTAMLFEKLKGMGYIDSVAFRYSHAIIHAMSEDTRVNPEFLKDELKDVSVALSELAQEIAS